MTAPVAAVLFEPGWKLWVEEQSGTRAAPCGRSHRCDVSLSAVTASDADFMFLRDPSGVISYRASNDGRVGTWPARPPPNARFTVRLRPST